MKRVFGSVLIAAFMSAALPLVAPEAARRQPGAPAAPGHDPFYFLGVMNKASVVMLNEAGIVPPALASQIAKGVVQVIAQGDKPGGKRPGDYLVFEEDLVAAAGPDTSRLHTGRSRQDLGSTSARMQLREGLLRTIDYFRAQKAQSSLQHWQHVTDTVNHRTDSRPASRARRLLGD